MNTEEAIDLEKILIHDIIETMGGDAFEYYLTVKEALPSCKHLTGEAYSIAMATKYTIAYERTERRYKQKGETNGK